ncbi:MAG: glycosyltransferase [Oscillospiraceae bacterium]|nr:glycosyltransferase [Oscillospiraceae bacterium]
MRNESLQPAVSVIIPIYMVEEYLRECVDSVINQTLKNIEIICVDDGSPDHSVDIVNEYAEKYDNIVLVRKKNGGLSSARNAGLDAATGRYVYFLDSDDSIEPETMEELCARADAENLDIIYFNTYLNFDSQKIRELNQNYVDYYTRKGSYPDVYSGQMLFSMMRKNREFFPSVCLQLFRRSIIEENHLRFYDGIIHEDNLFTFQCMILARRAAYSKKSYYHRRMRGDSIMTVGKSIRNVEGYLVCYAELLAFLHDKEIEEAAAPMISDYLYFSIYRNACTIYRSLNVPDEEAHLTKGDFCAEHLLELVKRNVKYENDIEALHKRIRTLEKNAQAAAAAGFKRQTLWLPRKIMGGFRCIRDHGLVYTIKRAIKKCWGVCKKIDRKLYNNKLYQALAWLPRKCIHGLKYLRKNGISSLLRVYSVKMRQKLGAGAPLVSIIMPVYNVEEFLEQGLDSLLNQTMKHIEIICVDDGSTDRSLEIMNLYAAKDKRVRVFTQQNKFAGAARNVGIANARGEYMIFLDSDDFFSEDLAKEAYYIARLHDADVVLFGAKHYNNVTGEFKNANWLLNSYIAPKKQPFNYLDCPDALYRITTPCPWTKMFRRQFVLDHGLQFQAIQNSNDLFFTYSALPLAKRIVTLDKHLVYYRVGLATNLQTTKKKHPLCFCQAYQAWHDKLAETGVLDVLRKSYVNVALSGCMHNLRTNKDPEVKRIVFDKLKNEAFESLEVSGHEASYYYDSKNYQDMMRVLEGSFEEYLETENTK